MISRVQPSHNGVVIRKCESRENRNEAQFCFGAIGNEAIDVRGCGLELVAEAEAIGGDEQDDGAAELGEAAGGVGVRVMGGVGKEGKGGGGSQEGGGEEEEKDEKRGGQSAAL